MAVKVDIQNDGLLWLINKACFHARGFALAYNRETGEFSLLGDGKEPWRFAAPIENIGKENPIDEDVKFAAVEAAFERARQSE